MPVAVDRRIVSNQRAVGARAYASSSPGFLVGMQAGRMPVDEKGGDA
jgi:hypothetical protein